MFEYNIYIGSFDLIFNEEIYQDLKYNHNKNYISVGFMNIITNKDILIYRMYSEISWLNSCNISQYENYNHLVTSVGFMNIIIYK